MSAPDPRLTLALEGVAALALEGVVDAPRYLQPTPTQAIAGVAALRREPLASAEQLSQLLHGERFDVLERRAGFAFGQALRDGYVGWVEEAALAPAGPAPTHWVGALRTHLFSDPSIKSAPLAALSMNALVSVAGKAEGGLVPVADGGWLPERHLAALGAWEADPAAVARRFLHAPYLWGGRGSGGLDCSGLVQQAWLACGVALPRDSDQQRARGRAVDRSDLARNDLVFWGGHVALMLDGAEMIHANAYHMAVAREPLAEAIARIGEPLALRRLS